MGKMNMYVEGRIIKIKKCKKFTYQPDKKSWEEIQTKKVYIKQFMTGYIYWGFISDCLQNKKDPTIICIEGIDNFHKE